MAYTHPLDVGALLGAAVLDPLPSKQQVQILAHMYFNPVSSLKLLGGL
jgi:hypothetical protein